MHSSSLPALAFMAAAVVPALAAQADDDHGDIPEAATRLQIGQPVAGVLEHASDEDYFRIDIMGRGHVKFSTAGPTDTTGILRDGEGRALASDVNSGVGSNFRFGVRVDPGIYYLTVFGGTGSYAVTARLPREWDEHEETASDSTLLALHTGADLQRIRPNVLLSTAGRIDPAGTDVDVFRIDVPRDGTDVVLRTASATATEGRLLDSSLRQIASDAGTGGPFRIERQLDAGIYYIEVRGAMKGDYRLLASSPNAETECGCSCPSGGRAAADHGDTALTATLMPIGRPLTGTIAHADDVDVFRIDVALGTELRLGTVGPTDTRGELRDATGALLAFDDRSGPQGHNFSISAQLAAGVYYLAVSGDAGNYAVGAWPANAADHGRTPALSSLLPIQTESDAKRIRPSMLLSTAGRIADPDADIHVFRLDVAEDSTQVTLRVAGNAGAHLRLLGDAVPPVAALATSDDTSVELVLDAGIHYVEVRGSTAGRYRLLALSRSRPCDELPADAASVPSAPNNLVASSGDGQVLLAWVPPTVGADRILHQEFRQRRQDGTYGDWTEIPDSAHGGTNASGLRIAGLVNGVTMFFEVRAVNAAGAGEPSNEAAATPTRIRLSAPATVRTGDASRLGNSGEPQRFAVRPSAADLDGDGDLDLLAVHVGRQRQPGTTPAGETAAWASVKYPSNYLAWYENDGQGNFSAARVIEPNGRRISDYFRRWSASAVDLDDDGDLDVLANLYHGGDRKAGEDEDLQDANRRKAGTAWYENEGGGQFSAGRPLSYADAPTVADLDGDADGDLVVLYQRISWVANEGGGRFVTRGWLEADLRTAGTPTYRAQAADMDGDGDADVVGGIDGGVFWYENYGRGGAFAAPRWARGGGVNTYRTGAAAGLHVVDIDGDADPDVLVAGPSHVLAEHHEIAWFENEGGSLTRKSIADGLVTSVHASDLDSDGDMDVLSASDSGVVLHENHGTGFSAGELIVASEVEAVHAADVDGDGDADVLYGSSTGDTIGWLRNTTARREPSPATLVVALPAFLHGALESTTDRDRYRVATGNGTLTVRTNGPTDTVGSLLRADETQLAEDDNAGVATNFALRAEVEAGAHFIDVRGTDGATGVYTLAIAFEAADDHGDAAESATPVMAPRVVWGRLQHDDDRDVFRIDAPEDHVIEVDAGEHGLALTDAQGTTLASAVAGAVLRYVIPRGTPGSTNPYFIHVVASGATPSAYTLTIDYSRAPSSVAFSKPDTGRAYTEYPFHLADVDGDGDADLIAGNEWWESPQWPARRTIADEPGAVDRVADLDADGDLDLLSASESITWRENQGDAAFGAQRVIRSNTADVVHGPLQAADLDGDGDLDVMATQRTVPYEPENDVARWYENQGNGAFSESRALLHDSPAACALDSSGLRWWEIPATVCPRMYLPADLDGDGLVDLIGSRNRRLIWFQNPGQTSGDARFSDPRAIGNVPIYSWDEARRVGRANSVHVADLDGDGDADIVAAVGYFEAAEEGAVVWHENEGGGEFAPQRPLPQTEYGPALAVRAADLDGDRDLDIVVVYERTYSYDCTDICDRHDIVWHENRGSGWFAPERSILTGGESRFWGLRLADVDSDGDADIVFVRSVVNDVVVYSVWWFENLADHGDDHGNTAAEAILTPVLPALVHGVLESPDDRDVFRVATGNGTLRVITNGPTDTLGAVLDADGRELAADDDSGTDANFALETQVTSGTHYVMVRGNGSNTGPYTLSLFFANQTPR